eukprot:gene16605-18291_t
MEDFSDEQINSLAAEWVNKIKTNVARGAAGLSMLEEGGSSNFDAILTGKHLNSSEQVPGSYDVSCRIGSEYELEEGTRSLFPEKNNATSEICCRQQQKCYSTIPGSITHSEFHRITNEGKFSKEWNLNAREHSGLNETNVDRKSGKSWLSNTIQQTTGSRPASGSKQNRGKSEEKELHFGSPIMPAAEEFDYNIQKKTAGKQRGYVFEDGLMNECQNELFEIWGFDNEQCKTALKYLEKSEACEIVDKVDFMHEKENILEKGSRQHDDFLFPGDGISSADDVLIKRRISEGKLFNDITNIGHDIDVGNDINELKDKSVPDNMVDFEDDHKFHPASYHKLCPACYQKNSSTANWCEECGKALVSVEVRKFGVVDPERNNNGNYLETSPRRPEESTVGVDVPRGSKTSSFKLNPNSAEFISAYSRPEMQSDNYAMQSDNYAMQSDNYAMQRCSPVEYSPRDRCHSFHTPTSITEQTVGYSGSFPRAASGFDRGELSSKHSLSPNHLSPDKMPVGCFSRFYGIDTAPVGNSYEGQNITINTQVGMYNSPGYYPPKSVQNASNQYQRKSNGFKERRDHLQMMHSPKASLSYDSSYDSLNAWNEQVRPRSTSLLNIHFSAGSPQPYTSSYPIFVSEQSHVQQSIQHCAPVTQPHYVAGSNGYQGFDFENPQFEPQVPDCQLFDEAAFSKEFVRSRLCQQLDSAYGNHQQYAYHHAAEMQNSLYMLQPMNTGQDPLVRMYTKKKLYNSSLDSPRSPRNLFGRVKKGKQKSAKGTKLKELKELAFKEPSESNKAVPLTEDTSNANAITETVVPPLSLDGLDTYDQVLTLIRTAQEEAVPYLCLPEEVILYILSFLPTSDLCRCSLVCRQFHRIATDESLWKEIVLRKRNDLSDETLGKIGQKRPISLTIAQCHSDKVTEGGLRELFRNCADSLQDLGFSACSGQALIGELILLHASRCKNLLSIDISWSNVSDCGIQAFAESVDRLECICMNGCQAITDESIRCIAARHSKSIRVIEMFGCFNISQFALSILQKHCPNLETINIGQCHKVTTGSILEFAKQMPKLENIDLRGCKQIRDIAIKQLASSCRSLSTLVIANCPMLTDASLVAIATHLPAIRCLDVCGCTKVTDRGVVSLAKACNKLEVLDLSSTTITDKGVVSLANYCHQTLESLKLSFCHGTTEMALEQLAKKCARLKLLHLYGCKRVKSINKVQSMNRKLVIER